MLVKEAPFILEFTKLLKTIIVSSPDKRADAGSVIGELKKIKKQSQKKRWRTWQQVSKKNVKIKKKC